MSLNRKMLTGIFIRNITEKVRSSSWLFCKVSFKYLKYTGQFSWTILMGCTLMILHIIFSERFKCLLLYSKHISRKVNNEGLKNIRSSPPEMLYYGNVLQICSKFTGEHPWRNTISMNCFFVNLLHIFRTPF